MSTAPPTGDHPPNADDLPRAKRSLGQNFLVDPNTIRAIIGALRASPGDRVFEIGPGRGALTEEMLGQGLEVSVLEKDRVLARYLADRHPQLRVIVGDAMQFAWEGMRGDWRVIGNLPYNVASPIIWDLVARTPAARRMVFTVQKEVAQRLCAAPGSRAYGALSVWVQTFAGVHYERTLGGNVFRPRPKVDSAVVSLDPAGRSLSQAQQEALGQVLRVCFQKRRKQLGSILKSVWSPELEAWLEAQGLDRRVRPEALSPEAFLELAGLVGGKF